MVRNLLGRAKYQPHRVLYRMSILRLSSQLRFAKVTREFAFTILCLKIAFKVSHPRCFIDTVHSRTTLAAFV